MRAARFRAGIHCYILATDAGFAPDLNGRYWTLACCKPEIRRTAQGGDVDTGGERTTIY